MAYVWYLPRQTYRRKGLIWWRACVYSTPQPLANGNARQADRYAAPAPAVGSGRNSTSVAVRTLIGSNILVYRRTIIASRMQSRELRPPLGGR